MVNSVSAIGGKDVLEMAMMMVFYLGRIFFKIRQWQWSVPFPFVEDAVEHTYMTNPYYFMAFCCYQGFSWPRN